MFQVNCLFLQRHKERSHPEFGMAPNLSRNKKIMQKTIEITTTQHVTIEYDLASLRERMLAWLLDFIIVVVGYFFLRILISVILQEDSMEIGWQMFIWISFFLLYFAYLTCMEIWNAGQTIGKKALGIKTVRLDGKEPEWTDVLLRAVLHLVDTLFSMGMVGILLIKTTPRQQRLGDMAAQTSVIKLFSNDFYFRLDSILSLSSTANYKPVYAQVRQLSEKDMLFIKTVLDRYRNHPNLAHEQAMESLTLHLCEILEINGKAESDSDFLKTLLRDYIVLTR
jgi:uncharacterized RDD family membrane protein YckC